MPDPDSYNAGYAAGWNDRELKYKADNPAVPPQPVEAEVEPPPEESLAAAKPEQEPERKLRVGPPPGGWDKVGKDLKQTVDDVKEAVKPKHGHKGK